MVMLSKDLELILKLHELSLTTEVTDIGSTLGRISMIYLRKASCAVALHALREQSGRRHPSRGIFSVTSQAAQSHPPSDVFGEVCPHHHRVVSTVMHVSRGAGDLS